MTCILRATRCSRTARELRRDGQVLPLTRKAFDLLHFFVENSGRPLAKAEILEAIWPGTFVEESNLNQNVFIIRRALGPAGEHLIVTLPPSRLPVHGRRHARVCRTCDENRARARLRRGPGSFSVFRFRDGSPQSNHPAHL